MCGGGPWATLGPHARGDDVRDQRLVGIDGDVWPLPFRSPAHVLVSNTNINRGSKWRLPVIL
jgi:hypothetical protein